MSLSQRRGARRHRWTVPAKQPRPARQQGSRHSQAARGGGQPASPARTQGPAERAAWPGQGPTRSVRTDHRGALHARGAEAPGVGEGDVEHAHRAPWVSWSWSWSGGRALGSWALKAAAGPSRGQVEHDDGDHNGPPVVASASSTRAGVPGSGSMLSVATASLAAGTVRARTCRAQKMKAAWRRAGGVIARVLVVIEGAPRPGPPAGTSRSRRRCRWRRRRRRCGRSVRRGSPAAGPGWRSC